MLFENIKCETFSYSENEDVIPKSGESKKFSTKLSCK